MNRFKRILMKTVNLLICLMITATLAFSQKKTKPLFKTEVLLLNGKREKGMLYQVDSASVRLFTLSSKNKSDTLFNSTHISEVSKILSRKKNTILVGFLVGSLTGAFVGYEVGVANSQCSPDDLFCDEELAGIEGAIPGALIGGILGIVVGAIQKEFIINGEKEKFIRLIPVLKKRSLL